MGRAGFKPHVGPPLRHHTPGTLRADTWGRPYGSARLFLGGADTWGRPYGSARLAISGRTRGAAHTAPHTWPSAGGHVGPPIRHCTPGTLRADTWGRPHGTTRLALCGRTRGSIVPTNSTKWVSSYLICPCSTTVTASPGTNVSVTRPFVSAIVLIDPKQGEIGTTRSVLRTLCQS